MHFTHIELILILCFYYVDKGRNVDTFTKRFNRYFNRDVSSESILHSLSKFKNIDPSNNIRDYVPDTDYLAVWNDYIEKNKIDELKKLYRDFKHDVYSTIGKNDYALNKPKFKRINQDIIINDVPVINKNKRNQSSSLVRNQSITNRALKAANYKCEAKCNNSLFLRKDGITIYTEAHHLIPLKFQKDFKYSLDVEANVISLCPMCHRRIHYGSDNEELLKKLYDERIDRLKSCGISISFEELLLMYR